LAISISLWSFVQALIDFYWVARLALSFFENQHFCDWFCWRIVEGGSSVWVLGFQAVGCSLVGSLHWLWWVFLFQVIIISFRFLAMNKTSNRANGTLVLENSRAGFYLDVCSKAAYRWLSFV